MLILDKFFLKYEGGIQIDPPLPLPHPQKSTLKNLSLIRVNYVFAPLPLPLMLPWARMYSWDLESSKSISRVSRFD